MNLLEQFSFVLLGDASHKYARCTSVVKLFSSNYHVSPAAPSDSLGLSPIFWKFVLEQVVEVRSCPVRVNGEDLCFDRLVDRFRSLLADGRGRGPLGTHLRQLVSLVVVVPEYVCQLQSVEGALQFSDLLAIG